MIAVPSFHVEMVHDGGRKMPTMTKVIEEEQQERKVP